MEVLCVMSRWRVLTIRGEREGESEGKSEVEKTINQSQIKSLLNNKITIKLL